MRCKPIKHCINNALGTHTQISRVQGGKLKSKNEIRVASILKQLPLPLLQMIVVHELAHLREKDHNKAFYKLCLHMEPGYHQLELDLRLYLTLLENSTGNTQTGNVIVNAPGAET
jgi:predicted metal-dependent hydrolase